MFHASTGRTWFEVLHALPFPAAVLNGRYRYVLLNEASADDPLLARGRVGGTDLDGCAGEPAALERARARHRQYVRSLRAQVPCCFQEDIEQPSGKQHHYVWLCLPISTDTEDRLAVLGFDATDEKYARSQTQEASGRDVNEALRVPLATIVAVAGTLVGDLRGAERERAALIEEGGQELLRRLDGLLERNALNSRRRESV